MKKNTLSSLPLILLFLFGMISITKGQTEFENWMHGGPKSESPTGVRTAEWYALAPTTKPKTVIVAVMDTGVDIDHPDLNENIWTNVREIPGNHIDDDKNGYVDDVHGWNFLGGPNGQSVSKENLEVTRLYGEQKAKWENVDPAKLSGKQKKEYEKFAAMKKVVEDKQSSLQEQLAEAAATETKVIQILEAAKQEFNGDTINIERLEKSSNEDLQIAAKILRNVEEQGIEIESIDWLIDQAKAQFKEQVAEIQADLDYTYNIHSTARSIVGDNPNDFSNHTYGNNNVDVPFAYHGTHVSGIIAAERDNMEGMNGIADHVAIMPIVVVPDGDERDKDVANGILYAVNNGAQVINMSFGKAYSPQKKWVDEAVRYAAKHDVLIVHGSGNESTNIDAAENYPNDTYQKKGLFSPKHAPNIISVGALSPEGGENTIAEFSNYGKREVDVFAPGVYIYSTTPDSTYDYASGTSMASPVVAGVAALIRSRYPDLSAAQVKDVIVKSARKINGDVTQPGTYDKVKASELSVSGGMVDVVEAMRLAASTKGNANHKMRMKTADYQPGKA